MSLFLLIGPSLAATLVVDPAAGPYTTITSAVSAASSGDTLNIAAGTYVECVDTAGKSLELVGASRSGTVIAPAGACTSAVVVDAGETVALRALTVRNTNQRALYVLGSDLSLSDVLISASGSTSAAGGGAWVSGSTLTVEDSEFSANSAYYGGAIYATDDSAIALTDSTVASNYGYYAGGIYLDPTGGAPTLSVDGVTIGGNYSYYYSGGVYAGAGAQVSSSGTTWSSNWGYYVYGGAIHLAAGADLSVEDDTFNGNYAAYYTSGYNGGAIYAAGTNEVTVVDSTFEDNLGYTGGAIYATTSTELRVTGGSFDGNLGYSSGGAIFASGTDVLSVDGVLFSGNTSTYGYGGALFAQSYTPLNIVDSVFANSSSYYSGGAIYSAYLYDAAVITGSTFSENTSRYGYGGAFTTYYATSVHSDDNEWTDNSAYYDGGAMYVYQAGPLSLSGNTLTDNEARYGSGGAIHVSPNSSTNDLTVDSSEFTGNTAYTSGGALYAYNFHELSLTGSRFTENLSTTNGYYGGAVALWYMYDTEVSGNLFCANEATYGGAVASYYAYSGTQTYSNNLFVENETTYSGGALYMYLSSDARLLHNNFVGNATNYYGGAFYGYYAYVTATNNIFAYTFDGSGVYAQEGYTSAYSDFSYNDWYVNLPADTAGSFSFSTTSNGNQVASPGFESYSADGDCTNDNFALAAGSALIDAGHPAYTDADGSTADVGAYGGEGAEAWDADGDGEFLGEDCDDGDATVYTGAPELCDGLDNNCDGTVDESAVDAATWYADTDGDGYGDAGNTETGCDAPPGYVADNTDCNDGDDSISPGASELAYDGIDQDCDGADLTDVDGDGVDGSAVGGADCDDNDASVHPGASETWYDGVDQDCDGLSDYDSDYDGHDSDAHGGDDCDDTDDSVHPGASETWYDGVDQDCDGLSDYDGDYDGYDDAAYGGDDCDDGDAGQHPGATEEAGDNVDQDCNGLEDCSIDVDLDGHRPDGRGVVASVDADCDDPGEALATDPEGDCNDADASIYPGAPETLDDGVDQDCDGEDLVGDPDTGGDTGEDTGSDTGEDTGYDSGSETGETGEDPDTAAAGDPDSGNGDKGGVYEVEGGGVGGDCGCSGTGSLPLGGMGLSLGTLALLLRRRR